MKYGSIETWHSRLGHLGTSTDIKRLIEAGILTLLQLGETIAIHVRREIFDGSFEAF